MSGQPFTRGHNGAPPHTHIFVHDGPSVSDERPQVFEFPASHGFPVQTTRYEYLRLVAILLALGHPIVETGMADDSVAVSFNREVRPIFAENCLRCHGPDAGTREAELRLDQRDNVMLDRGGYDVIAPGDPDATELIFLCSMDQPHCRGLRSVEKRRELPRFRRASA